MKILLCKDVEKLGWLGDVVEVKKGYARNYLLPQGLGTVPTDVNIRALSEEKTKHAEERKLVREQLERAVAAVEGAEAVIDSKANEQGHLYGSVSAHEIAGNLREQGYEVSDDMVQLSEHIKEVGTHEVTLKLAPDLAATISVVVVSQDETVESIEHDNQ